MCCIEQSLFQYGIFFKSLLLNAIEEIQKISAVSPPLCDEARIVKLMNSHRAVEILVKLPRQNENDDESIGQTYHRIRAPKST